MKNTFINLFTSISVMLIGIAISFFLTPYITRTLGVQANGFIHLSNNFITFASLLSISLNSMLGRFISINYHNGDIDNASKYYSSALFSNFILFICLAPVAILVVCFLDKIINIENSKEIFDVKLLFAFSFFSFLIGLFSVFGTSTYVKNKLYISSLLSLFGNLTRSTLIFLCFYLLVPKLYYVSITAAAVSLITLVCTYIIKTKILKEIKFKKEYINFKYTKELISSGIWNSVNQLGNILMTGFDLLLANLFINPVQMGILAVAKMIPVKIIALATTINGNFSPLITISYAKGDRDAFFKQLRSAMKISSVLVSIPIVVFCVHSMDFYSLWVSDLDAKKLSILSFLTLLAFIPASGTQALYNVFTSMNKLRFNSIAFLINGAVNVVLMYVLLKTTDLGLYAIAGVSSITTIIRQVFIILPYIAKLLNLKFYTFYKDVGISLICAFTTLAISSIVKYFIVPSNWLFMILSLLFASLASLLITINIVLSKSEKNILMSKIPLVKKIVAK